MLILCANIVFLKSEVYDYGDLYKLLTPARVVIPTKKLFVNSPDLNDRTSSLKFENITCPAFNESMVC